MENFGLPVKELQKFTTKCIVFAIFESISSLIPKVLQIPDLYDNINAAEITKDEKFS